MTQTFWWKTLPWLLVLMLFGLLISQIVITTARFADILDNQQTIIKEVDQYIGPTNKLIEQGEQSVKRDEELRRQMQEFNSLWHEHVTK